MAGERLLLRDAIGGFAPGQGFRAALLLTYSFDGRWIEEGLVPDLFDRQVDTALVIRDGNALIRESPSVRYHRANAQYSKRVFHPKLVLLVADDRALAIIGSANLTRGGLERNLELASAYEISPEGGPRTLFEKIQAYLSGPLLWEVSGSAAEALADMHVALGEVLGGVPKERNRSQLFLHNYERTLWDQILAQLPHRHVARVSIVSPFFEPNHVEPEDPRVQPRDESIFERLFKDLKFEQQSDVKPVTVYFQQSEGETQLPLDTLHRWKEQIDLRQRSATSDGARPLHAKLLVIEGSRGPRQEPYLIIVHGSPNFTSAALLSRPPEGNAEIAVLTVLPWKRNAHRQICAALQLDSLFGEVQTWNLLKHVAPERRPPSGLGSFQVCDALLHVKDRKLLLTWRGATLGAKTACVLIELDGGLVSIGSVELGEDGKAEMDVPMLVHLDEEGLLSLNASLIRVELRDDRGKTLVGSVAPINVDCPDKFIGVFMVSHLITTLDAEIAHAGCGVSLTYREQKKILEQHRTKRKTKKEISVLTHQADLDRFFRNLHSGFKGLRARREALPDSEYTLRRTLKDLGRWCGDTVQTDCKVPSVECRVFLMDRLGREIEHLLETVNANPKLSPRLGVVTKEIEIAKVIDSTTKWARSLADRRITSYVTDMVKRLQRIKRSLGGLR
jgi:hypothetical protein